MQLWLSSEFQHVNINSSGHGERNLQQVKYYPGDYFVI